MSGLRLTASVTAENLSGLAEKLEGRLREAAAALGEAVIASSDPYVPYRTGNLASSVSYEAGEGCRGTVRWSAPYAAECYTAARPFSRKIHPLATARWFEAAKSESLAAWQGTVWASLAGSGNGNQNGGIRKDGRIDWMK